MLDLLRHNAGERPDQVAIREGIGTGWRSTTRAELYAMARVAAQKAESFGMRPGPVVVVLDNSAESVAVLAGLMSASVEVLAVERPDSVPAGILPAGVPLIGPTATVGAVPDVTYPMLTHHSGQFDTRAPDVSPPDMTLLQLTSGSTGAPRIVRHRTGSIRHGASLYREIFGITHRDTVLVPLPFAHSFGLVGGLTAAVLSGAQLLTTPVFNLRAVHRGLAEGASVLLGTPLLYEMLAASAPAGLSTPRLRVALSSGGPLAPRVADAVERYLGRPVLQVYGSTETGLIACQRLSGNQCVPGAVGICAPGVRWRIEPGDDGGRLLVSTSTMLVGYQGPSGTRPGADGYFDTGDVAVVHESGQLCITARKDSFVNVGGRKVNPDRVEERAADHPWVREAKAFGRPGPGGQELHLAVVLAGAGQADTATLTDFLRGGLAPYEVPRHLHVLDRLPRTALGKVSITDLVTRIEQTASDPR